jgi:hypothetical protein
VVLNPTAPKAFPQPSASQPPAEPRNPRYVRGEIGLQARTHSPQAELPHSFRLSGIRARKALLGNCSVLVVACSLIFNKPVAGPRRLVLKLNKLHCEWSQSNAAKEDFWTLPSLRRISCLCAWGIAQGKSSRRTRGKRAWETLVVCAASVD